MKITIPELSVVVLIGASGSGKSTFARKHFKPTELLSSDFFRGLVSDDENDQTATERAFEALHFVATKRLESAKLTVIDATNVQQEARQPLVQLARKFHAFAVVIVLKVPEKICLKRNETRSDRQFGSHVVRQHCQLLRRSIRNLEREGFRYVYVLDSPEEVDTAEVERQPLWNNRRFDHGPFDIIGDIHGCFDELAELLNRLGYQVDQTDSESSYRVVHPEGRRVVFLGDLVDRGPKTPEVLRLVMDMVDSGTALCVPGNHDTKLLRKLNGKDVRITHGLAESLKQLENEPPEFIQRVSKFLDRLISHYVLDDGRLVVSHAGMKADLQGRGSGRVRDFALYGETSGETDEYGLPIRYNWASDYRGKAIVVYGHTPVPEPEWLNGTINVDTGCVFGGKLTALRYPEKDLVSVPARFTYYAPAKPFLEEEKQAPALTAQQQHDDLLDIEDVIGKRIISTSLYRNVTVREENAIAALEVMSRFAVSPKWLIYLPPTMSPCETSNEPGLLEHPAEAFSYYRTHGAGRVVCEEKHMGSRAVVIVCREEKTAVKRFGVFEGFGICYTRTGRRFFEDRELEQQVLEQIHSALSAASIWETFQTDWVCLDCELMPWSAKAQDLLQSQYAAVGTAANAALQQSIQALNCAGQSDLVESHKDRLSMIDQYVDAYRGYCWSVRSVSDLKLAPFHLLATEGKVHIDRDHVWHMESLQRICETSPESILLQTKYRVVDLTDTQSCEDGIAWWKELTENGNEGMVVKPFDFVMRGRRGLLQPAIKCRGREYLRIIYGPEYTHPENLERLRSRGLSTKRSLALREFALGVEALERFVRLEPLRRVHECVFGALALESEPVDPRL
ncbi:polynucleotide kinase-phosphatase [bacterium]|nr:polynucleotide kinase-phosphatase [bacterium]